MNFLSWLAIGSGFFVSELALKVKKKKMAKRREKSKMDNKGKQLQIKLDIRRSCGTLAAPAVRRKDSI